MDRFMSKGEKVFSVVNNFFLGLLALTCMLPVLNLLALSFSSSAAINTGKVMFWPVDFNIDAYLYTVNDAKFLTAFWISVKRVVLGITISMVFTVLTAYPLSKDAHIFRARNAYANFMLVTMLIGGGLVPTYVLLNNLKMLDTIWALVLPSAVPIYNIILLQNFYRTLPKEIEEAAFVDGADVLTTLWKVYLPLSKPAIATLVLYQFVGHWNSWFDGMIYMNSLKHYPLQTYLQSILINDAALVGKSAKEIEEMLRLNSKNISSAQIFVTLLPILMVYPFLQKYFAKGIVLGSVKG